MTKPAMIGTVNGFCISNAKIGRKNFTFNGTTRGLVDAAIRNGAKIGTIVHADFGGGFRPMTIYSAPHDDRCGGFWAR